MNIVSQPCLADGEFLGQAEHVVDLAQVLDAVAGVVLVRREVGVDEEEGGAK